MMNKALIIGNAGKDPEVRGLQDGGVVANMSVATSERWKDKNTGEQKEVTEWHRISVWGKSAEFVRDYIKKGAKVYVEGKIQTRKYTDAGGVEKYSTEIVVQGFNGKVMILDSKKESGAEGYSADKTAPAMQQTDDDISW